MAAPEVAIHRLFARIRAPTPDDAFSARGLVAQAVQRIGPGVDRALERAGLDAGTVIALPRIALRLHVEGEATAAELGDAWAEALARAIIAAMPGARAAASHDSPQTVDAELPAHFHDLWEAEAALLRALATDKKLPWWAERIVPAGFARDAAVAALLMRWIERDALRAAARMVALMAEAPALVELLDARQAAALAARLLAAWDVALNAFAPAAGSAATTARTAAMAAMTADAAIVVALMVRLPTALRTTLAGLPEDRRAPWIAASLLTLAPAHANALPAVIARLATVSAEAWRTAEAPAHEQKASAPAMPLRRETTTEVWCGGLLLLIRPLIQLRPAWFALGDALPPRLLTLGLIALRRLAAPLPPAARRAALERDRPLLALFAGVVPPDTPLEEVALPHSTAEAEDALAVLLAATPEGVAHAPGAVRRAYGRDPFVGDPANDALCRLLLRPGRLAQAETTATLIWPLDAADIALRRAGWDFDPGWVPWLGRRIAFRYGTS